MSRIEQVEKEQLLLDLYYYKKQFDYKQELLEEIENEFLKEIDNLLEKDEYLKNKFYNNENKINSLIERKNNNQTYNYNEDFSDNNEFKDLYRKIVKETHPDKNVDNNEIKEKEQLYKEALNYYKNNQLSDLILIAYQLNIDFDLDELKKDKLKEEIEFLQTGLSFIENNISWRWYYTDDEEKRKSYIKSYIKNQIIS